MAIYMKIEGIDGVVQAKGYEKWIEIYSVQWSASRSISNATSSGDDRGRSIPYVSELTVSKLMDMTSPNLFLEACKGTAKKIEIHHVKSGEGPQAYLKYELTNGLLSNYSVSSDGESPPFESLSLNFTKIEMNYIDYDPTTKQSKPIPAVYDLTQVNKG